MLQFECQKNKTYIEGSTSSTSVKQGINQSIRLFLNNDCLQILGYKGDNGGLGHLVKHLRQVAKWPVALYQQRIFMAYSLLSQSIRPNALDGLDGLLTTLPPTDYGNWKTSWSKEVREEFWFHNLIKRA